MKWNPVFVYDGKGRKLFAYISLLRIQECCN